MQGIDRVQARIRSDMRAATGCESAKDEIVARAPTAMQSACCSTCAITCRSEPHPPWAPLALKRSTGPHRGGHRQGHGNTHKYPEIQMDNLIRRKNARRRCVRGRWQEDKLTQASCARRHGPARSRSASCKHPDRDGGGPSCDHIYLETFDDWQALGALLGPLIRSAET